MYLPQFHQVKENDEWWGKGFTEWTTVKNAKPLFEGHEQPRVPLNDNYYNLLDKKTMEWQSGLMKEYGIDGMCIYHYWFKDGRRILEKPAENLLKWTDVDMPFCFCWANETWARSWSSVGEKNVWADAFEEGTKREGDGILLEQKYGGRRQWEEHFDYLLPFFRDGRYITMEGCPVFVIYRTLEIPCLGEMLECWRERAAQSGLKGLYVIGAWADTAAGRVLDAKLYHEPPRTQYVLDRRNLSGIRKFSYADVWESILEAGGTGKTFFGGFVSYDDTPRRGTEGCLTEGAQPEGFCRYLTELMAKNEAYGNDIVFLNAWNEWGEGMYLEPDTRRGYGYLEAVRHAKRHYKDRVGYYKEHGRKNGPGSKELEEALCQKDKVEHYIRVLDAWMGLKEDGVRMAGWFRKKNYGKIALYGYGPLGKHFLREMKDSGMEIGYLVDRQGSRLHVGIPVYLPEEELPDTDVVVVAATFYFSGIYRLLKGKGVRNIVSLEHVIMEMR